MNNFNFLKDKKIIVTGHTGFKGSWLVMILSFLVQKFMDSVLNLIKTHYIENKNFKFDVRRPCYGYKKLQKIT